MPQRGEPTRLVELKNPRVQPGQGSGGAVGAMGLNSALSPTSLSDATARTRRASSLLERLLRTAREARSVAVIFQIFGVNVLALDRLLRALRHGLLVIALDRLLCALRYGLLVIIAVIFALLDRRRHRRVRAAILVFADLDAVFSCDLLVIVGTRERTTERRA